MRSLKAEKKRNRRTKKNAPNEEEILINFTVDWRLYSVSLHLIWHNYMLIAGSRAHSFNLGDLILIQWISFNIHTTQIHRLTHRPRHTHRRERERDDRSDIWIQIDSICSIESNSSNWFDNWLASKCHFISFRIQKSIASMLNWFLFSICEMP